MDEYKEKPTERNATKRKKEQRRKSYINHWAKYSAIAL